MTTKTMMMALAMAMGLAASASVIEVKFTVKTDVNGKVTTKTYKGVYDTTAGKHAFYDTKAKKTIDGSYFGLVNDATAGKKIGQNAELIWGDASNPENVLVAGAWGTDSSKSGQVAGIIDGKPATGTWTAKVNTKKTYEELLKKYKITAQPTNKATSVIEDKTAAVAAALNDAAAAKAKGDADLAAAQAQAAADLAAAQTQAAADLAAAQAQAAADLATAQAKAAADLAEVQKAGEDAVTAAQNKAAADLEAAEAKAAADLATAEAKAAADIAAAQKDGADAVAAAEAKAAEDLAKVEADNAKALADAQKAGEDAVAAAEAKAAEELAAAEAAKEAALAEAAQEKKDALDAAQAAFDKDLAAKQAELDDANETVAQLIKDLDVLDDPDMYAMVSTWIATKNQNAKELYQSAYWKILTVTNAYTAYADSFDVTKLEQKCVDATNAWVAATNVLAAKQQALDDANATKDALSYTNEMLDAIYDRNIKNYFDGDISQTEEDLANASNTLAQAKQNAASTLASLKGQLESKVSSLASASNTLAGASSDVATAKQALADAETAKDKAKEAKDGAAEKFVEPSYENGKLLSYEQWVGENAVNLDPDKVDYHDEYDTYKSDTIAEEKEKYLKSFNDAYDAAVGVYNAASNDYWNVKLPAESAAKRSVTSLEEDVASLETQIKAIEEGGDTVAVKAAKDEVERLEKKLADIKAELEFWLAYKYSDNEKSKIQAEYTAMVDETIPALEKDKEDAQAVVAAKEQAIKDANKALEDVAATQEALLKKLEEVTPGCVLRDGEQKALPLDTIKTEVDKFVAPYEEYEGDALNTGNALRSLVKNLKIGVELEDMESWKTAPAEEDSKGSSDEDEGGDL